MHESEYHDEISNEDLLARCRQGDTDAQRILYERFSSRLILVAQSRIGARLGRRLDGDDVIQSVFRTFFRRVKLGEYAPVDSSMLWGRLVRVTLSKTCDAARAQAAAKRNMFLEEPSVFDPNLVETLGREPEPDHAIALAELLESLFVSFTSAEYASIVELTLQGYEKQEIAQQVGVSKRTVDRVLARTREFLEKSILDEEPN